MIFNYTNNYQFTTRLSVNGHPLDVINSTRLLGTVIQSNLCWDQNTRELVKKANARMELLRKVSNFCTDYQDLKNIYILFVRSILEQSATVWHSSLTEENKNDLERVQKSACKLILGEKYKTYSNALKILELENLDERRRNLCLTFALRSKKHPKMKKMFPLNEKTHKMETRNPEKYRVQHAFTERLKSSPIIYMQNLLNESKS